MVNDTDVFDTFTFKGRCGHITSVVGAKEQSHECAVTEEVREHE